MKKFNIFVMISIVILLAGCGGSRYTPKPYYKASANPEKFFNDTKTGLMWQDDYNLPFYVTNWSGLKDFCAKKTIAGHKGWRVPTIHELVTLVDYSKNSSYVKGYQNSYRTMIKKEFRRLQILPGKANYFISSTLNPKGEVLVLDYKNGTTSTQSKTAKHKSRVICVRGNLKY